MTLNVTAFFSKRQYIFKALKNQDFKLKLKAESDRRKLKLEPEEMCRRRYGKCIDYR